MNTKVISAATPTGKLTQRSTRPLLRTSAVSLLALAVVAGCASGNNQLLVAEPTLITTGGADDGDESPMTKLPTTREEALRHPDYVIDPGGGVTPKACWTETPGGGGSFNGDECELPWWPATMGSPLPDNFEDFQLDPQVSGSSARTDLEMRIINALGDNLPKGVRYDADTNLVIITIFTNGEDVPISRINKYRQLGQAAAGGIMVEVEVSTDGVPRAEMQVIPPIPASADIAPGVIPPEDPLGYWTPERMASAIGK